MDKLSRLLDKYNLQIRKGIHHSFIISKKGERIYEVNFEMQNGFDFKKPNYYLRIMSKRLNFFETDKEEGLFLHEVFLYVKEYADKNIDYSYLFVNKDFLHVPSFKNVQIDSRFQHFITYGYDKFYDFKSHGNTEEVDSYMLVWNDLFEFFQKEKSMDPRFDVRVVHKKMIYIYKPDTEMELNFSFKNGKTEITVLRREFEPKTLSIESGVDRFSIQCQIENFFNKVFGQNRIKAVFKTKKRAEFHQAKIVRKVKEVSFFEIFKELRNHYTDDELEKAAAIENDNKNKENFVFKSDILSETIFLANFQNHCFIFKKDERNFIDHFTFSEPKEAIAYFQKFRLKMFKDKLKEEKKELQLFLKNS